MTLVIALAVLNIGVLFHPYLLAQVGTTVALAGLLVWSVSRVRSSQG
jgi:hypothetical protein